MKLTCVTAVFNAIKSGNRENLIRCVRSVAALKTEHEHLIYDGGSTDGTVELLRELEREVEVESRSRRVDGLSSVCGVEPCRGGEGVDGRAASIRPPCGDESGALVERALPLGVDRRACAEKKVEEWLAGVDEAAFEAALAKLVEEKTAAGEYVFEQHEDIAKSIEAAKRFFNGFSRRIVELSDGRCVYFAPDPRSKMRNSDNTVCWAEYAFHSVSSGGDRIPGKNYTYRHYSPYKIVNTDLIEPTLRMEKCVPVLKSKSALDAVKFFGTAHLGGLFDVVVRLDEYGNVNANMTEVTFEASTKRGQKKLPQLVSLTEAIRTVVSHQTATGTYPPNKDSIAFCTGENKGGGALIERALPGNESSAIHHSSFLIPHSPTLRVVSEPDTGIYNALNKGVRDAQGEWFYVLGCDDYICHPQVMDRLIAEAGDAEIIVAPVERDKGFPFFHRDSDLWGILWHVPYSHQGTVMRTDVVREFGGFDERFRICADWDMMRKEHDAAKRFKYTYEAFAFYGNGGASEVGESGGREMHQVIREHAGLVEDAYQHCREVGYYPFAKTVRYCFHGDRAYRIAGRHMFYKMVKPYIRYALYPIVVLTRPIRHRKVER